MGHQCNAWCFGNVHALLYAPAATERAAMMPVAQQLAGREGMRFLGVLEVATPNAPQPGTPTQDGVVPARVVVWASR